MVSRGRRKFVEHEKGDPQAALLDLRVCCVWLERVAELNTSIAVCIDGCVAAVVETRIVEEVLRLRLIQHVAIGDVVCSSAESKCGIIEHVEEFNPDRKSMALRHVRNTKASFQTKIQPVESRSA